MRIFLGLLCLGWLLADVNPAISQTAVDDSSYHKDRTLVQAKIPGGIGFARDMALSKKSYLHFSAGWFVLLLDFSAGPGISLNRSLSLYTRAHLIYGISPLGGSAYIPGFEPGFRVNVLDRIFIEVGLIFVPGVDEDIISLPGIPNVGILLPLDALNF